PALLDAEAEVAPHREPDLPQGAGELLLVVDDEANIRDVTRATLERFGYRVVSAADGTEGIAAFAENKGEIAGVLTDISMPFMDGPAMIRALRKMDPDVKIIAMSGLMNAEQTAELEGMNVHEHLQKPFSAEVLLKAVNAMLKGS